MIGRDSIRHRQGEEQELVIAAFLTVDGRKTGLGWKGHSATAKSHSGANDTGAQLGFRCRPGTPPHPMTCGDGTKPPLLAAGRGSTPVCWTPFQWASDWGEGNGSLSVGEGQG